MVKEIVYPRFVFVFGVILFLSSFVFAAHMVTIIGGSTSTSYSINESVSKLFNFSINNSDAGQNANITQFNITWPSELEIDLSDASSTLPEGHESTIGSTSISVVNGSGYLINGSEVVYFWVNYSSSIPGDYNITVSTLNGTGTYSSNISVEINDTTAPFNISFMNNTPVSNANLSQDWIQVNVSVNDSDGSYAGALDTIRYYLYYSNGTLINSSNTTTNNNAFNFTNLSNGIYYINVTANDTLGNVNSTGNSRIVILDTTDPGITFSCTPESVSRNVEITCSCSGTDSTSGVNSTSYTVNPSTSSSGSFVTNCTITDYAGNSISSNVTYTVTSSSSSASSSQSKTEYTWTATYSVNEAEFKSGYTRNFLEKQRAKVVINSEAHYVGIVNLTNTSVKVEIASEPQEAIILVGEEKKFEVTGDDRYDILVKLNSVEGNNANITILSINETFVVEVVTTNSNSGENSTEDSIGEETIEKNFPWIYLIVFISILLFIALAFGVYFTLKNKKQISKYLSNYR